MTAVPILVSIDDIEPKLTRQRQPMAPLVSADRDSMDTALLSGGVVYMSPGHASRAHRHRETDLVVLLWRSGVYGALTMYGDRLEHEIWQQPGQLLWIPRGVPHVAINSSTFARIVAFEFRSNPVLGKDNDLLEELQPIVETRQQAFGGRRFWWHERWLSHAGRRGRTRPCAIPDPANLRTRFQRVSIRRRTSQSTEGRGQRFDRG